MAKKRYVVIGEGAAGLTAVEEIRRLDPHAAIGLFTEEPQPGYFRAALTNYLLGELREDQLWVCPPDFYEAQSIQRAFAHVVNVDAARGEVWDSSSSQPTPFDALLVASGARPRPPTFEGATLAGVATLRTLFDARAVMDGVRLRGLSSAVILGGGPLGLEWAHALHERGARVTLVERASRLMPSALDEVASDLLAARLRQGGIELALGDEVVGAEAGASGAVAGIQLRSGRRIGCELVAAALGVIPNSEFLRASGVALAAGGAVRVDATLQTSAANLWAAGDVASVEGKELALWEPARHQGRIAARNMVGGKMRYEPGAHYFATRLFDLDFARIGDIKEGPGRESVVDFPRGTGKIAYRKLVLENGVLLGALMLGERSLKVRSQGRALKQLIDSRANISAIKDRILANSFDLAAWSRANRLVSQPAKKELPPASMLPAKVRGTQALRVPAGTGSMAMPRALTSSALGANGTRAIMPLPPTPSAGTRALGAPRGTRMLSIGLPAEARGTATAPRPASSARLVRGNEELPVLAGVTTLGQSPEADVRLTDARAAGLHAQIQEHEGSYFLRDLGSQLGTWVNGEALTEVRRLADGDNLQIAGESLIFRSATLRQRSASHTQVVAAPRLFVRSGAKLGLAVRLLEAGTLIGSDPQAALCLNDAGVFLRHALVRAHAGNFFVEPAVAGAPLWVRDQPLGFGAPQPLREGDWLRVGSVDLVYSQAPTAEASHALAPGARLSVDSGPAGGQSQLVGERALVGSGPNATWSLPGLAPLQLEVVRHGRGFFVRDLSGGRSMRAGRPLAAEWSPAEHGDLFLLGGALLLRFEET
jgi:NADPH-dependent 2,4-dienoyl-CoA reductase/sulfur reductase-like enzyme